MTLLNRRWKYHEHVFTSAHFNPKSHCFFLTSESANTLCRIGRVFLLKVLGEWSDRTSYSIRFALFEKNRLGLFRIIPSLSCANTLTQGHGATACALYRGYKWSANTDRVCWKCAASTLPKQRTYGMCQGEVCARLSAWFTLSYSSRLQRGPMKCS